MEHTEIQKPSEFKDTHLAPQAIKVTGYTISAIILAIVYLTLLHPVLVNYGGPDSIIGILSKIVFIPLIGILSIQLLHRDDSRGIKILSLIYCIIPLLLSIYMFQFYDGSFKDRMQFEESHRWIRITDPPNPQPGEDFRLIMRMDYHIGVDGFSFPLLLLTAGLGVIAMIGSWGITKRMKEYFTWYLLLYLAMLGTFCSLNYVLFYIFWELMLVPMYFLIGIWGGPNKEYAAIKFFLYTFFGSIFLLVAILYMFFAAGQNDFDMLLIQKHLQGNVPLAIGRWMWLATFLGFAIKLPLFPFHTWLPDAHVEAPTPISVILAGVLLKMGAYGMLRITFPNFPEATHWFIPLMLVMAVINIVYGAAVAMAQEDLKRLVAFSSIGHMGFVLLGFASMNQLGYTGAMFQVLSHGFISGALFLLVGVVYDRAHTRGINEFGGLAGPMRKYFIIMLICSIANLGLPPLSGFWGEFTSLLGAFKSVYYVGGVNIMRVAVVISVFGILITAAYMLWMVQRMFLGSENPRWEKITDMDWREQVTLWPLVAVIIGVGIFPNTLIKLFDGTTQGFIEMMSRYTAGG
jgi:NADH-quinone oxidoreductase subunit M